MGRKQEYFERVPRWNCAKQNAFSCERDRALEREMQTKSHTSQYLFGGAEDSGMMAKGRAKFRN